jgi:hypothetical protein
MNPPTGTLDYHPRPSRPAMPAPTQRHGRRATHFPALLFAPIARLFANVGHAAALRGIATISDRRAGAWPDWTGAVQTAAITPQQPPTSAGEMAAPGRNAAVTPTVTELSRAARSPSAGALLPLRGVHLEAPRHRPRNARKASKSPTTPFAIWTPSERTSATATTRACRPPVADERIRGGAVARRVIGLTTLPSPTRSRAPRSWKRECDHVAERLLGAAARCRLESVRRGRTGHRGRRHSAA